MSKSTLALIALLTVGIVGYLVYSRTRSATPLLVEGGDPAPTVTSPGPARPPTPRLSKPITPPAPAGVGSNALTMSPSTGTSTPPRQTVFVTPEIVSPAPEVPTNAVAMLLAMEQKYRASGDEDQRMDLVAEMSEIQSAESIRTMARIFAVEMNADLKVDILDALQLVEGFKEEKMAFLKSVLQPGQSDEVREAAIDSLIDLEDPSAIALLEPLLRDPSEAIRESARDAIEILKPIDVTQ